VPASPKKKINNPGYSDEKDSKIATIPLTDTYILRQRYPQYWYYIWCHKSYRTNLTYLGANPELLADHFEQSFVMGHQDHTALVFDQCMSWSGKTIINGGEKCSSPSILTKINANYSLYNDFKRSGAFYPLDPGSGMAKKCFPAVPDPDPDPNSLQVSPSN
jgi:hypothetical protein